MALFRGMGTLEEDQFWRIGDYEFGFEHVVFHLFIS